MSLRAPSVLQYLVLIWKGRGLNLSLDIEDCDAFRGFL